MPIETICKGCARKPRVGDEHAGRRARCPHCRTVYQVPQSTAESTTVDFGRSPAANDLWYLRSEDGSQYGPVGSAELAVWVGEGRVTRSCEVRRENEPHWRPATEQFPVLSTGSSTGQNPFAEPPVAQTTNPYVAPRAHTAQPHRGGVILAMGVVGLVCCQLAAPFAWRMGHADLAAIRTGQMDPAGQGMTKAGMILGIAGTLFLLFSFVLPILRMAIGFQ